MKDLLDSATDRLLQAAKHPLGGHLSRDEASEIIRMIGSLTSQLIVADAKIDALTETAATLVQAVQDRDKAYDELYDSQPG